HETLEGGSNAAAADQPADDRAPQPDRALVAKPGASILVEQHEPIAEERQRAFDPVEPDLVGLSKGNPFHRPTRPAPTPRGRDWRHEFQELAMALAGKNPRGAAILLLGAEGGQDLKRQAPIGVDVTLDGLEPNGNDPRAHGPALRGSQPSQVAARRASQAVR